MNTDQQIYINQERCQCTGATGRPCSYAAKFKNINGTLLCGTHARKSDTETTQLPKKPRKATTRTAPFIPDCVLGMGERYTPVKPAYYGEQLCQQNKNKGSCRYIPCQGDANYVRIDGEITCARCAHPDQRKQLPTRK